MPLFSNETQKFVWAQDIKPHLTQLAQEYLSDPALPELGLIRLSGKKEFAPDSYLGALFGNRRSKQTNSDVPLRPEAEKALVERLTAAAEAPPPRASADLSDEDVNTTFVRSISRQRGRFPMMPKGVE